MRREFPSDKDRRLREEQRERKAAIEKIERESRREPELEAPASDAQFQTLVEAQSGPRHHVDRKRVAKKVPAHLAEAQVSLVLRCPLCQKPLTGDDAGKPAHRRCPR